MSGPHRAGSRGTLTEPCAAGDTVGRTGGPHRPRDSDCRRGESPVSLQIAPARRDTHVRRLDPRPDQAVKTARERAEEKRAEKLAVVREQVENGSLVIRKMTDAERRRYPPRTDPQPRRGKR